MIKVLVNGATGSMGQLAVKHIQTCDALEVVATPTRRDNLTMAITQSHADVVLDLTVADVAFENTKIIIESGSHPVIGTSGLTADQIIELQHLSLQHHVGGIIVPNFSIGAVLMMQFSETASHYFNNIHIIETHHLNKKDKPSGTARRTAELMANAKAIDYSTIPITSYRRAEAIAEQDVIFKTDYESLTIKHNSTNRECFMPGVLLACKKALHLTELVVGLDKIM